jgi:hypothetical protein
MNTPAPIEILQRYFSVKDDPRVHFHPHTIDGRACSTNGQWIAVLDTPPDGVELRTGDVQGKYDPRGILAAIDSYTGDFVPASAIGISAIRCRHCEGTGLATETDCDDCDGDGWFSHGSHTYECKNCDGLGVITQPGTGTTCSACYGTGNGGREYPSTHGDTLLNVAASSFYVAALRAFGGEISTQLVTAESTDRGTGPLWVLRFPGGRGALMPMNRTRLLPMSSSDLARPPAAAEGGAA